LTPRRCENRNRKDWGWWNHRRWCRWSIVVCRLPTTVANDEWPAT